MTVVYGCGKFSEDAWIALVTAEGEGKSEGAAGHALSIHLRECPACRTEFAELRGTGRALRETLDSSALAKEAFVASVLSEVAKARGSPGPSRAAKTAPGAAGREHARHAGVRRERLSFLGRLASRPAALAVAAALALVVVGASGLFPWRPGRPAASGYTAPGGVILSLSEPAEALAAALTTQGVAAAVAGSESTPETTSGTTPQGAGGAARAIRAPLGIAAAVAQANET